MGKFMDWLRGDVVEDFGPGPVRAEKREEKKKSYWDRILEEQKENRDAFNEASTKADDALKAHVPVGAAFRIIQANAGHYEIQRLEISNPIRQFSYIASSISAETWRKSSVAPIENYISVSDGGRVMTFNIFAEAEAYLTRMCRKTPSVAEYDFPPLKKRAVKAEPPQ